MSVVGHETDVEALSTNVRCWGAKRACGSTLGQRRELLVPLDSKLLEEVVEFEGSWLLSFENGFGEGGGEQGEAEIGFVDRLGFGKVADGGIAPGLQHVAPAVGADDGLDDGVVDARRGWDPGCGATWRHHLLTSTLVAQRDGDVDGCPQRAHLNPIPSGCRSSLESTKETAPMVPGAVLAGGVSATFW